MNGKTRLRTFLTALNIKIGLLLAGLGCFLRLAQNEKGTHYQRRRISKWQFVRVMRRVERKGVTEKDEGKDSMRAV